LATCEVLYEIANHCLPPSITSTYDITTVQHTYLKDRNNSFAIMAPLSTADVRRVRGFALYPVASIFNHNCLPNIARFDDFDSTVVMSQVIIMTSQDINITVSLHLFVTISLLHSLSLHDANGFDK
jgi:hypothetical protein